MHGTWNEKKNLFRSSITSLVLCVWVDRVWCHVNIRCLFFSSSFTQIFPSIQMETIFNVIRWWRPWSHFFPSSKLFSFHLFIVLAKEFVRNFLLLLFVDNNACTIFGFIHPTEQSSVHSFIWTEFRLTYMAQSIFQIKMRCDGPSPMVCDWSVRSREKKRESVHFWKVKRYISCTEKDAINFYRFENWEAFDECGFHRKIRKKKTKYHSTL